MLRTQVMSSINFHIPLSSIRLNNFPLTQMQLPTLRDFYPSTNCNFIDNTVYSLTGPLVRNKVASVPGFLGYL